MAHGRLRAGRRSRPILPSWENIQQGASSSRRFCWQRPMCPHRTGRNGAAHRARASLPKRAFRRHGVRPRTSHGGPRSAGSARRRRSCGAIACIVTSQIGTSVMAAGAAHPQLARDDRALAERETSDWRQAPRIGRDGERCVARRRSLQPNGRQAAVGASGQGDRLLARCSREAQPGHSDAGHRRRACLRLVRQWSDRGARHGGARGLDAPSGHRVRAVSDTVGARELAGPV